MKLYLMRHAQPEPGRPMNASREITDKGRDQIEVMGKFLVGHIGTVDIILTSTYLRAVQTAQNMAAILGVRYEKTAMLDPDAVGYKAWGEIIRITEREHKKRSVLVISHDPTLNELIAFMCGASASQIQLEHASITHVNVPRAGEDAVPTGMLHWSVEPRLIEDLVKGRGVAEAAVDLALEVCGSL